MRTNSTVRVWTVLFLGAASASPAIAADDTKHPAYDFQPTIVYSDPALISESAALKAEVHDTQYPAAHFEPSVIHAAKPAEVGTPDPKYPAAYFTPSVVQLAK